MKIPHLLEIEGRIPQLVRQMRFQDSREVTVEEFLNDISNKRENFLCFSKNRSMNLLPFKSYWFTKSQKWMDVMRDEMDFMMRNKIWELVDLPSQCKSFKNKWILKIVKLMDQRLRPL